MDLWMIFVIISVIAVLVEIFVPTLFCINFAIAGIITAVISFFWGTLPALIFLFLVLSILSLVFVKPLLSKHLDKDSEVDFNSQYIGKVVECIEPINTYRGAVSIYDERWEARIKYDGEEIQKGTQVKIVSNDSTILFVEKLEK